MPEGSDITGTPGRAREIEAPARSRAPGEQPMLASPASENPRAPASLSFQTWHLPPGSSGCAKADEQPSHISFDADDEVWEAAFKELSGLRPKIGGPNGLAHIQKWMSRMDDLVFSLWLASSGRLITHGEDIARVRRQLRGLRHEHNARASAARTHSSRLDQLSDTVRQLQQQLESFAAATVAVLEVETGGGAAARLVQGPSAPPSIHSSAAAAAGRPASPPGVPNAADCPCAAADPAAGAATRPHQLHPPVCAHPLPLPSAVAANKLLFRGVSSEQAAEMARGDFTALGLGEGPVGMYERRWRASGTGRVWNVEVVVTRDQRAALIRAAARIKHTAGVTVAPFLTPEGRTARRARQAQFDSLVERGLQPYWRGTDIVTEEGDRRRVHTMQ